MAHRLLGATRRAAAATLTARHCVWQLAAPGLLFARQGRRRLSGKPDTRDSEGLHEWDRSVSEAIEQAKRELAEQKATLAEQQKQKAQPEPGDRPCPEDAEGGGRRAGKPGTNSQPPKSPKDDGRPPASEKGDGEDDYIVVLGRVMIELPEQIESFFGHGLDGSIYTENVRFVEPQYSGAHISGKSQYLGAARVLRLAMGAYFSKPRVTILSMRQLRAPAGGQAPGESDKAATEVLVRWVFEGAPRHTELIGGHESRFEGEFRYVIDPRSGLVAVHEVTSIHPTPPTSFIASGIARWMGWAAPRGSFSLSRRC